MTIAVGSWSIYLPIYVCLSTDICCCRILQWLGNCLLPGRPWVYVIYISQCIVLVSLIFHPHYNLSLLWRYVADVSIQDVSEPAQMTVDLSVSCVDASATDTASG